MILMLLLNQTRNGELSVSKKKENIDFRCENCNSEVKALKDGSYRNHCPVCLHSKHLDVKPGDRASQCKGLMEPVGRRLHSKKGVQIVHRCVECGHIMYNKITEDYHQPDDIDEVVRLIAV